MRFHQWKFWATGGALLVASLTAAAAVAQERPRVREEVPQQAAPRGTANRPADQTIADCLGISNQEEIALATLAASKSENPQVKEFAEMLVKDHSRILSQLEPFGARKIELARQSQQQLEQPGERTAAEARGQRNPEIPATQRTAEGRGQRRGERAGEAPSTQRTAAAESGLDFIALKRQMAQRCLVNAQQQWNELTGAEADQCFVGSQAVLHQQMIDAQEVLKPHASPQLQQVIDEGIAVSKSHLDQAKNLMKQLAGAARETPRGQQ